MVPNRASAVECFSCGLYGHLEHHSARGTCRRAALSPGVPGVPAVHISPSSPLYCSDDTLTPSPPPAVTISFQSDLCLS